jgi:flagellar hook-associated protein 2
MENVASSVITSLGGGSGIDFVQLARDLTDAEKAPQESRLIQAKEQSEAKISAVAVLKYNVDLFIDTLNTLNDASEISVASASSSDLSTVAVETTDGTAAAGSYQISTDTLASSQRNVSQADGIGAQSSINGGDAFTIRFVDDGGAVVEVSIDDGQDSLSEIADAINSSGSGYRASAIATGVDGGEVKLVVEGQTGSSKGFSISALADSDQGAIDFFSNTNANEVQAATNATFSVNGVEVTRESNQVGDVIAGVSFTLEAQGASTLKVTVDHSTLKSKLSALVQAYNDVQLAVKELGDPESQEEIVGGALARDKTLLRSVKDALYDAVTSSSSVTSGGIEALRDVGISLTKTGDLSFDEAKFDTVVEESFDDIGMMLSAGTNDQSQWDPRPQGLAFDAIERLDVLTDSIDGLFINKAETEESKLEDYEQELADLEASMERVYQRYVSQFSIMESLVSSLNSTRESMSTTWENMTKSLYSD